MLGFFITMRTFILCDSLLNDIAYCFNVNSFVTKLQYARKNLFDLSIAITLRYIT